MTIFSRASRTEAQLVDYVTRLDDNLAYSDDEKEVVRSVKEAFHICTRMPARHGLIVWL